MLTTVLFDMGGTLEDIWHNEGTKREALQCVWDTLRAHGLEPEVDFGQFQKLILEGIREYKTWCDLEFREKKPEEIWPEYYRLPPCFLCGPLLLLAIALRSFHGRRAIFL